MFSPLLIEPQHAKDDVRQCFDIIRQQKCAISNANFAGEGNMCLVFQ